MAVADGGGGGGQPVVGVLERGAGLEPGGEEAPGGRAPRDDLPVGVRSDRCGGDCSLGIDEHGPHRVGAEVEAAVQLGHGKPPVPIQR